jgi:hypothetical protein
VTWGGDATVEFTIVDDGGNMVVQGRNRTSAYLKYASFGFDHSTTTGTADVNRQSFRAKYVTHTSTRVDRGVQTNWNGTGGDGEYAHGYDGGTGFQFSMNTYTGVQGSGELVNYTGAHITNAYAYTRVVLGDWTQFDMLVYRNTVGSVAAGTIEYYVDGDLTWTSLPALTGEWVLGDDLATPSREMRDFEFWSPGKDGSGGTMFYYFDDVSVQYANGAVPEPSSLVAFATFGIGAFGLIRRRRA